MSNGLSGKVSVITGASSGLGLATAVMFAQRGAMITLCGRDQDRLKTAHDQCTQASGGHADRFITVLGDLNDNKVREDTVAKTVQKFGRLDILVPNAGMAEPNGNIQNATEEGFDITFNTNVKSVFFLIQRALPHLEQTKGNIVSVSSLTTRTAFCSSCLYALSKAAVDHMTQCLALDLGPKGIRVNAVNPSYIPTRIRRRYPGTVDQINVDNVRRETLKQPMGQCGTAEDVAEAISFLASDAAKFITGECLLVDGGRNMTGPQDS